MKYPVAGTLKSELTFDAGIGTRMAGNPMGVILSSNGPTGGVPRYPPLGQIWGDEAKNKTHWFSRFVKAFLFHPKLQKSILMGKEIDFLLSSLR